MPPSTDTVDTGPLQFGYTERENAEDDKEVRGDDSRVTMDVFDPVVKTVNT